MVYKKNAFVLALALFLLLTLSILGIALVKSVNSDLEASAKEIDSYKSYWSAKAGVELALYKTIKLGICQNQNLTLDGFSVVLTCQSETTNEGGATIVVNRWSVQACNKTPCPAAINQIDGLYVERSFVVQAIQ